MNSDYLSKPVLLQVKNLVTSFQHGKEWVRVVDGVSFDLRRGATLGIIGESGCGKTITSLSLMRLIPKPMGKIEAGEIFFEGQDLLQLTADQFRLFRGGRISMIFQEPMTSLNPVLSIGKQMAEGLRLHCKLSPQAIQERSIELLREVGISDPANRLASYPHQLSGGMKQRIMIAMAIACNPQILIADEPTTALDVTIQAQILKLLKSLREKHQMSMVMITHDLGVVAQTCDYVMVMYAGRVVEEATTEELFRSPSHPYTKGLMQSILSIVKPQGDRLYTIPGIVPSLGELPEGCSFQNRCPYQSTACLQSPPPLVEQTPGHRVACFHPQ